MLSTEKQQQRMLVLYIGFWFCLKQSGQMSILTPSLPRCAQTSYVVIAKWLNHSALIHLEKIQHT